MRPLPTEAESDHEAFPPEDSHAKSLAVIAQAQGPIPEKRKPNREQQEHYVNRRLRRQWDRPQQAEERKPDQR